MNLDHDTLIAYAMGMLSDQEMLAVEMHLKTNPDDVLEVKRYLHALSAVVMTEEPAIVPWVAKQNLLTRLRAQEGRKLNKQTKQAKQTKQTYQVARVKDEREAFRQKRDARARDARARDARARDAGNVIRLEPQESRRKYQWGLGVLVAVSLTALAFYGPFSTWYDKIQLNQRLVNSIQQSGAVSISLVNDINESIGTLVQQNDNSLFVVMNEKLSDEQVYQAWNMVAGQPQSLGIYQKGVIQVSGFDSGNTFGVTIEPVGGSEQPTSTLIVIYEF